MEKETTRCSKEYQDFRQHILERDNYCCKHCGRGKFNMLYYPPLEVHHVKSWKDYPELRLDENNCFVLCKRCHKYTDNFGSDKFNYLMGWKRKTDLLEEVISF